tara:strand:+ start:1006 stop:1557 length:552 start_codon:yes stop_codon:yes gene_type:complete
MNNGLNKFLTQINEVLEDIPYYKVENIRHQIDDTKQNFGRVFLIGNGGSQAICSHIATDLFKRCKIQALSLNSDALITCLANDYGFDQMYVEWLKVHDINENDLLIAISSSGRSPDILSGIKEASDNDAEICFINGFDEFISIIEGNIDTQIFLDSRNYGVVELSTEIILHSIVERLVEEYNG